MDSNGFLKWLKRILVAAPIALVAMAMLSLPMSAVSGVSITPATATTVSIDTTSAAGGTSTWTALGTISGPIITENAVGGIATGLHVLTLPAGWEFNIGQNVTIGLNGTDLTLGNGVITPGTNTLTFNVTAHSTTVPAVLTFSNIQVRPTGTVVGSVNVTHSGPGIVGVTDGVTSFGNFTTVHGTATGITITPGSASVVVASTQAYTATAHDQFNNTWDVTGSTTFTTSGGGSFAANIFSAATVTGSPWTVTGTLASPVLSNTASVTVTPKALTVSGITGVNKVYNGNTTANLNTGGAALVGVLGGQTVTLNTAGAVGAFADKNIGTGKTVTISGLTIGGADVANYTLTQP
ncbi:hypothetical protein DEALK_02680, partial [Dehalogenimonas alkenigignens]